MTTMTVSEARAALPDIVERVLNGDEVTLTRHGVPVVVIVRPDTLRARRADEALATARAVRELLTKARQTALARRSGLDAAQAEALVADVRASRSGRS